MVKMRWLLATAGLAIMTLAGCQPELEGNVSAAPLRINITHQAGGKTMALGTPVTNPHGETYTLSVFNYYLSNFYLIDTRGTRYTFKDTYFLVKESVTGSKQIELQVPAGRYTKLGFLIGVDSIRNVSGVQTGALDPAEGMFWTWTSGYIMAKMEATSPSSKQPAQKVEYHIGGFSGANNTLEWVELDLPAAAEPTGTTISTIALRAEANAWFTGVAPLRIADHANITSPGALAVQVAGNYANMFAVTGVTNQ
jgi:hypothetical protein